MIKLGCFHEERNIRCGEDELCCSIAEVLVDKTGKGFRVYQRTVAGGAGQFKKKIPAMNQVASNVMPVLMVADADQAPSPAEQIRMWLPAKPSDRLCLRLAVREAEAWVLADNVGFSEFAMVSKDIFPISPENELDPKGKLLSIIRRSKRRELREEMLPAKGSMSVIGLGYNIHIVDFVKNYWNIDRATARSPSLGKAFLRLNSMLAK
ncbi:hypothetical protein GO497_03330 [Acidovorax citrulli]|nr:hypothetical protein [Paracidovorax citrulli]